MYSGCFSYNARGSSALKPAICGEENWFNKSIHFYFSNASASLPYVQFDELLAGNLDHHIYLEKSSPFALKRLANLKFVTQISLNDMLFCRLSVPQSSETVNKLYLMDNILPLSTPTKTLQSKIMTKLLFFPPHYKSLVTKQPMHCMSVAKSSLLNSQNKPIYFHGVAVAEREKQK